MNKTDFKFVNPEDRINNEQIRPGLTYWKDAWRRLKKNTLAMIGLVVIFLITLFGVFGPFFTPFSDSDQVVGFANIPPRFEITQAGDTFFYFNGTQYNLFTVTCRASFRCHHHLYLRRL